jgi:hypothetical protein
VLLAKVGISVKKISAKMIDLARTGQQCIQPPPQAAIDEHVAPALKWAAQFVNDFAGSDDDGGDIALDYAWRKYERVENDKAQINAKEEQLLQAAAAVAAGELGLVKFFEVAPGMWLLASLACMLACVIIVLHGRRTRPKPALPPVCAVLEGLQNAPAKRWWLAAAIHPSVESQLPHALWHMRINQYATYVFVAGLFLLVPVAFTRPSEPAASNAQAADQPAAAAPGAASASAEPDESAAVDAVQD